MQTRAELEALNGTEAREAVMIVCNRVYQKWQFEQEAAAGLLPDRIVKKGWKHTHDNVWTWLVQPSLRNPEGVACYRTNQHYEEVAK